MSKLLFFIRRYYQEAIPVYAVAVPSLIAVCLLGVLANSAIVFCAMLAIKMRTQTLKLTTSLAASDAFSLILIAISLLLNSYLSTVYGISYPPLVNCSLFLLEALRLGSIQSSLLHVLMLAIGQQLAVSRPALYRQMSMKRWLHVLLLTGLWVCPPLIFLIVFLVNFQETFGVPKCKSLFLYSSGFRIVTVLLIFIPLSAIAALYMNVWQLLRRRSHHGNAGIRRSSLSLAHRYLSLILVTVGTFLLGWLPATVWFGFTCEQCPFPIIQLMSRSPKLVYTVGIVVNLSLILKGQLNPLVYAWRLPEIRTALLQRCQILQLALGGHPPPEMV